MSKHRNRSVRARLARLDEWLTHLTRDRRLDRPESDLMAIADAVRERSSLRPPLQLVGPHNDVTELLPVIDGDVHASAARHLRASADAS